MNYQDVYKQVIAEARMKNFHEVREKLAAGNPDLLYKIRKRSEEYGIPVDTIIADINTCDTAVIPFAVSPKLQNIYEKAAARMIEDISGVTNFKKLPNNSTYVCNGAVIARADLKQYPEAKTIDFEWDYNGHKVFASHKYTKDSGGSQDNQYKDMQNFIRQCRDTKEKKTVFVAIADGDYYSMRNGRAGTTKMGNLESLCTRKVIACRMETLRQKLDEATKQED